MQEKMKKKIFLLTFLMLFIIPFGVMADDDPDVRDLRTRERIMVGGNLGLQLSNINTMFVVSPTIAYRLTNRITPGVGLTYQYYRSTGWGSLSGFTSVTHMWGGSFFTRYSFTRQIFAHVEAEALNLDSQMAWRTDPDRNARFWEYNYFVGGGYRAPLGPRANLNMMILYNLNGEKSMVYFQNPIFRFGIDVSL
jgi:hypothetical protein